MAKFWWNHRSGRLKEPIVEIGNLYTVGEQRERYSVVKILALDEGVIHVRLYNKKFDARPNAVDMSILSAGSVDNPDELGIAHLPLSPEQFHNWQPVFTAQEAVSEDELTGYRLWKEHAITKNQSEYQPDDFELAHLPKTGRKAQFYASAIVPDGWYAKSSYTLVNTNGKANIIFSSEPLSLEYTAKMYADEQGRFLRREFVGYEEVRFVEAKVFSGKPGYLRHFEWTPKDGVPISQTQLYYAEGGRGYTATATATKQDYAAEASILNEVLDTLLIDSI